jgi:hypothetical protein
MKHLFAALGFLPLCVAAAGAQVPRVILAEEAFSTE